MSVRKVSLVALVAVFFVGCGAEYMRKVDTAPAISPDPAKATLVLFRSTSWGFAKEIYNYCDKSYIGTTKGKCYFVTKIDPGTHYIIADAENKACAKVYLEANKVYYLQQGVFLGVMSARTGFSGTTVEEFEKQKPEMDYVIVNPQQKPPVLDEKDFAQTTADFDKEDKEDSKKHADTDNLKGF